MKSPYVNELQPNQVVTATFLVHNKDVRQKKTGEPYLSLQLADRTGELDAKMWDNAVEVMETFDRDDFVRVKGLLQIYQNRPQLTIHKLQRVTETDVDFADYFPVSRRDPNEMFAELEGHVGRIQNVYLQALLKAIFTDEKIARAFRTAPAAKAIHHAWLGGLIEHVLSLAALARVTAVHYPYIDADLLMAGVILHDIGKIYELAYDRSFAYTTEGQLLGHIVIGLRIVEEKLGQLPGFPEHLRILVEHMILSHHGEVEFGSPKVPMFPEALLLHHLDNLDSKMECMRALIERDRHVEGFWTNYSAALDRPALKIEKYVRLAGDEKAENSEQDPASTPAMPLVKPAAARPERQASVFGSKLREALGKDS